MYFTKKCFWLERGQDFDGLGWLLAALAPLLGPLEATSGLLGHCWLALQDSRIALGSSELDLDAILRIPGGSWVVLGSLLGSLG